MKKLLGILIFTLFLASCSTEENKKIEPVVIENQTTNIAPKAITATGDIVSQTGAIPAVATGSIQVVKPILKRTLAIENNNVVLLEEGKKINQLTKKGNAPFGKQNPCDMGKSEVFSYKIISSADGDFGLVQRQTVLCNADFGGGSPMNFYVINLNNGSDELTDISKNIVIPAFAEITIKIEKSNIVVVLSGDNVAEEPEPYSVALGDVKKAGFTKSGKNWIKTINITKLVGNTPKQPEITKTEVAPTPVKLETVPSVGMYEYRNDDSGGSIKITKLTSTTFDVSFSQSDGNHVGGDFGKATKQSNDTWLLSIPFNPNGGGVESEDCKNMSASLRFVGNTIIVSKVNIPWLCVSGMRGLEETTYTKK